MKHKQRKPLALLLLLSLLLWQGFLLVAAEEEIDYEPYDRTTEALGLKRPTSFTVKITDSQIADGQFNGTTFAVQAGHNQIKSFEKVAQTGDEKSQETKRYNLTLTLDFDARASLFTGTYTYQETITASNKVPDIFLDLYPDGERNEFIRRTYSGPVKGSLTISSEEAGLDGGNIAFMLPKEEPWPEIYYEFDDGSTSVTELDNTEGGNASIGSIKFAITQVAASLAVPDQNVVVDTNASAEAGAKAISVPAIIVIGLTGTAAAAAGAVAVGGSPTSPEDNAEKSNSNFKLVIYKDFGNKIRVGDKPVTIKARMVEVTAQGTEVERPDLTKHLKIFSPDKALTVGTPFMVGNSLQSLVQAPPASAKGTTIASQGVVSFKFSGERGSFQNNVSFALVGENKIKLAANKLAILGTSQESSELEYELIDFLTEPKLTLKYKQELGLFKLALAKNKLGNSVITATPTAKAGKMNFQRFVHRYLVEMIAQTDKQVVKEQFELHLCYEGLGTAFANCRNNTIPNEIILECFTEAEKDKRQEKAYWLPLTVMRWNKTIQQLEPDEQLIKKLQLKFKADPASKTIGVAEADKIITQASILAQIQEMGPYPVKADLKMKPVIYQLYPAQKAVAQIPEIEMLLTVSDTSAEFKELQLKARLKPLNDYRAMLKWFIEYGKGTYVDKFLTIGEESIFFGALDFIDDRVYSESNMPYTPKTTENHYEDGYLDIFRPNYVYLQDNSLPHKIGEFKRIQTLYHELCHVIEHQHGDTGGDLSKAERHTYFIEYLSQVIKALADLERGAISVKVGVQEAIRDFYYVFNNPDNAQPQMFSWFGVKYITQHQLFERYAEFALYSDANISESRKELIAKTFRERYFPGNLQGKTGKGATFKEKDGFFKGATWHFNCSISFIGLVSKITLTHPDYKFTVRNTPQWVPGTLNIRATYDVESITTGKTDVLEVELNGGSFTPSDSSYPKINKFTVTWRATDKISDCIMSSPKVVTEASKS